MRNVSLTLAQIEGIKVYLADQGHEDDTRLLLDMIEGETDAFELVRRLLNGIEQRDGDNLALAEQIADRTARKKRNSDAVTSMRATIGAIMGAAGVDKIALPEATVGLSAAKPKLLVIDPAAVPDDYQVIKRDPDKRAINAAFENDNELPNWLTRDMGEPTIRVTRK